MVLCQQDELTTDAFQLDQTLVMAKPKEQPIVNDEQELNLEKVEKSTIELALKKHRFNISHAAKELGLTRAALYRRMEKHGI